MRIDAIGHDGNKDSYFGVIEEILGARLWSFEDSYVSVPMGESSWRRRNDRPVWVDNSGLQKN